jgi:hypothetical protein
MQHASNKYASRVRWAHRFHATASGAIIAAIIQTAGARFPHLPISESKRENRTWLDAKGESV